MDNRASWHRLKISFGCCLSLLSELHWNRCSEFMMEFWLPKTEMSGSIRFILLKSSHLLLIVDSKLMSKVEVNHFLRIFLDDDFINPIKLEINCYTQQYLNSHPQSPHSPDRNFKVITSKEIWSFLVRVFITKIQNKWKEIENLPKIEEITVGQSHENTWKLNRNILMEMAVFLNQKRANVCEHTTKVREEWMEGYLNYLRNWQASSRCWRMIWLVLW